MQIHELNTYTGTPSNSDYLAVDDGVETMKIPITEVGVTAEMTTAEAEAGTETEPRVLSPAVLNSYVTGAISPVAQRPYIVDEGATSGWKYRKWSSGKVEAWGEQTYSSIAIDNASPSYGGYRSNALTMTIPSGIFSGTPNFVFMQKKTPQGGSVYYAYGSSATTISFMMGGATSASTITNQTFAVYAVME